MTRGETCMPNQGIWENVSMADRVVKSVLRTKAEDWASGQVLQSIGTTLPSRVGDMGSQG